MHKGNGRFRCMGKQIGTTSETIQTTLNEVHLMKSNGKSVNETWNLFQSSLEESVSKNVPTKTTRKKDQNPWITRDIKKLIKKRDRWYKRMKKSGNTRDHTKYKDLKKVTQRELRRAYWKYIDGIVSPQADGEQGNGANKRFWTFIKHKKSDGNFIPPLKANGLLHSSSKEKANILNNQFQEAFSESINYTDQEFREKCEMFGNYHDMPEIHITEKGVFKLLNNINISKSPGPDNISPRILKELAREIAPILTLIFNQSYQSGEVPAIWRTANICPIYKQEGYDGPGSLT